MNNSKLSKEIIKYAGGKNNITFATACMTRLRLSVKDKESVDFDQLDQLEGVLGTAYQNNQLQIIIGTQVDKLLPVVQEDLEQSTQLKSKESDKSENEEDEKIFNSSNVGKNILEYISASFGPILIAIIGAGVIKGLDVLFVSTFELYSSKSGFGQIINILGDAPFFYLPMLLAFGAASKLKTSIPLALVVAGSYMYPSILNSAEESWTLLGMEVPLLGYNGSVLPILMSVYLLSIVFKAANKYIPEMLKSVFVPIVTLAIVIPISIIVLGPLGFYLSSVVSSTLEWLFNLNLWIAGFIYGALRQFLVLTGLHLSISPIILENLNAIGYDYLSPVHAMSSMSVAGTLVGVFFKAKKKGNKTIAISSFIPGVLGITEPGIFGVVVRFMKPFIAVAIGGGIGSAFVTGMGARAYSFALPGPLSIAVYAETIPIMLIGWGITFFVSLIIAYLIGIDEEDKAKK